MVSYISVFQRFCSFMVWLIGFVSFMDNLVNEPLPAASISKDNARGKEKETLKCEIIIL